MLTLALLALLATTDTTAKPVACPSGLTCTAPTAPKATTDTTGAVTAVCKDGTHWRKPGHRFACAGHKGVALWVAPKTPPKVTP